MADKPTYTTVSGNAVYSAAVLSAISDALATAIEGTLGRGGTGESPNSMSGTLDMDTNRIQNLGDPSTADDAANKTYVDAAVAAGDYFVLQNLIEGYDFAPIANKKATFSFWIKIINSFLPKPPLSASLAKDCLLPYSLL